MKKNRVAPQSPEPETDVSKTNMSKELRRYQMSKSIGRRASSSLITHSNTLRKGSISLCQGIFPENIPKSEDHLNQSTNDPFAALLSGKESPLPCEEEKDPLKLSERQESLLNNFSKMKSQRLRLNDRYKSAKWIIFPDDPSRIFWNFLMVIAILYSVIITPLTAAFPEEFESGWRYPELFLDVFYILDIIMNFIFFAYKEDDGLCVIDHKKIRLHYLVTWFPVDFVSGIPLNWIELITMDSGGANIQNFARYLKLPRIYRVFRLTRVAKLIKEKKDVYSFTEFLKIPPGLERLIASLSFNILIFHMIACLWITLGMTEEENHENWIFRLGLWDETTFNLYIISFYWTVQTVFTVGYGDIPSVTIYEKVFAMSWMLGGVFVYSFLIGSISSMLSSMQKQDSEVSEKKCTLIKIRKDHKLPKELYKRVKEAISVGKLNVADYKSVLEVLPPGLKTEMVYYIHRHLIQGIDFFDDKPLGFVAALGPHLHLMKYSKGDIIYNEGDHVDEIYFIKCGKVAAVLPKYNNFKYLKIQQGYYFGEVDLFFQHTNRKNSFMATKDTQLLVLHKEHLEELVNKLYKSIGEEMSVNATIRKQKMAEMRREAEELLQSVSMDEKSCNKIKLTSRASVYKSNPLKSTGFVSELLNRMNINDGLKEEEKQKDCQNQSYEGFPILGLLEDELNGKKNPKNPEDLGRIIKEFEEIVNKMVEQEKAIKELRKNLKTCICKTKNVDSKDFSGQVSESDLKRTIEIQNEKKETQKKHLPKEIKKKVKKNFVQDESARFKFVSQLSKRFSSARKDTTDAEESKSQELSPTSLLRINTEEQESPNPHKSPISEMKTNNFFIMEQNQPKSHLYSNETKKTKKEKHHHKDFFARDIKTYKPIKTKDLKTNQSQMKDLSSLKFKDIRNFKKGRLDAKNKKEESFEDDFSQDEFVVSNKMSLSEMYENMSKEISPVRKTNKLNHLEAALEFPSKKAPENYRFAQKRSDDEISKESFGENIKEGEEKQSSSNSSKMGDVSEVNLSNIGDSSQISLFEKSFCKILLPYSELFYISESEN